MTRPRFSSGATPILIRRIEHLHRLGPRALAGFFDGLIERVPDARVHIDHLLAGAERLDPAMLAVSGADRWPALIHPAPDDEDAQ